MILKSIILAVISVTLYIPVVFTVETDTQIEPTPTQPIMLVTPTNTSVTIVSPTATPTARVGVN